MDLISPRFLTRPPGGHGDNAESNPQSLVSTWSQLDSGNNSRLQELRAEEVEAEEAEMLPCRATAEPEEGEGISDDVVVKPPETPSDEEEPHELREDDISVCDNDEKKEDENPNCDKENVSPDDEGDDVGEPEPGKKKKNKKRRKHAKKKPKGVSSEPDPEDADVT